VLRHIGRRPRVSILPPDESITTAIIQPAHELALVKTQEVRADVYFPEYSCARNPWRIRKNAVRFFELAQASMCPVFSRW
jgi:hypothetical protein